MLAALMITGTVTYAQSVNGIINGESITIVTNDKRRMILNGYDANGILTFSRMFSSENGIFEISSELSDFRLRASFDGAEAVEIETANAPVPTDAPEATAVPLATQSPQASEKPAETEVPSKSYPDVYEREIDAIDAIAVVDEVSYGENEHSEPCYYVNVLYQGSEMSVGVKADIIISESSEEFSYMNGCDMSALLKGDVISLTANIRGEVNKVGFIYRPADDNIATDGNDYGNSFEKLISKKEGGVAGRKGWSVMTGGTVGRAKNELAFGAVYGIYGKSMTLLGADGNENNTLDLTLDKNTVVYVCDMSARKKLSIENIGGISKSSIPKNAADSNGFITFSDDYKMNYALARVVNGTVTDAVIYKNYNR